MRHKPATGRVFPVRSAVLWPLSSSKLDTDKDQHATKPKRTHPAWFEPLLLRKHQAKEKNAHGRVPWEFPAQKSTFSFFCYTAD
jgi:hypothetical protein